MPALYADRDAYVAEMARRERWAWLWARTQHTLGTAPDRSLQTLAYEALYRSDAEAVVHPYAKRNDHLPDLENPVWLNEKIRWQFLHHPNPLMSLAADKIAVRDYLRFKGARVAPPDLIAAGEDPRALEALDLPERFVLKSNHGSGQMHFMLGPTPTPTPTPTPPARLAELAREWREMDQWRRTGELHYRGIAKRWLVEELVPARRQKLEFKVTCILGEPVFLAVVTERDGKRLAGLKHAIFDPDWRRLDLSVRGIADDLRQLPRPKTLDLVLEEARRLSEDFLQVRVDFLQFDDRLVFSELTFASLAARVPFEPLARNAELGALMDLSQAPAYLARGHRIADALGWQALAA